MKTASAILVLQPLAVAAVIFDTILPTTRPTQTTDPWMCSTKVLESFFDVPKPTGKLLDALLSYGDDLQKDCKPTLTNHVGMSACAFPPQSKWCAFSTSAPSTLLSDYSSYASSASSWWSGHSSAAVDEAVLCPNSWFKAMMWFADGPAWLNDTIAFAGCYAAAQATDASGFSRIPSATTGAVVTTSAPKSTEMPPSKSNAAPAVAHAKSWLVLVGAGVTATAANAMF
ncbi:hypothetical protein QQS21_004894 [Conoideocrella luteorostrata]|uniref:DUF7735 domain-containing protein n=1 Tax=Conoideocrella luteorostrata TaxID=1105319 RepID=A0AAJ0FZI1_9HYPO|nr:hypothetical protein QQS21_004894 [Conoideocrella luteorostrata]